MKVTFPLCRISGAMIIFIQTSAKYAKTAARLGMAGFFLIFSLTQNIQAAAATIDVTATIILADGDLDADTSLSQIIHGTFIFNTDKTNTGPGAGFISIPSIAAPINDNQSTRNTF